MVCGGIILFFIMLVLETHLFLVMLSEHANFLKVLILGAPVKALC